MPQAKAQLLVQLAQAAARVEGRQQAVLPQVAVNVWDTITGGHAPATSATAAQQQQHQQQHQQAAAGKGPAAGLGRPPLAGAADRLAASLRFLHLQHGHQLPPNGPHAQQLLAAQHAAALHSWGPYQQPTLGPGGFMPHAADTAALWDTAPAAWHASPHNLQASPAAALLGFPGLPSAAMAAGLVPPASTTTTSSSSRRKPMSDAGGESVANPMPRGGSGCSSGGGSSSSASRKPRFNSSISLNKQIMNTHNTRDLHAIVRSKGSLFDFFNISSAIARVPKLVSPMAGVQVGCWGWGAAVVVQGWTPQGNPRLCKDIITKDIVVMCLVDGRIKCAAAVCLQGGLTHLRRQRALFDVCMIQAHNLPS